MPTDRGALHGRLPIREALERGQEEANGSLRTIAGPSSVDASACGGLFGEADSQSARGELEAAGITLLRLWSSHPEDVDRLNLSNAAAVAVYEALRQGGYAGLK
jgi:hypothetical protein